MSIEIEKLVSQPEPTIVIYDDTFDAEDEVSRYVHDDLLPTLGLLATDDELAKEKVAIALQSIVFLVAESISGLGPEVKDALHLQKEHFQFARAHLPEGGVALFHLVKDWQVSLREYLASQLKINSRREAIFNTCERFKIDLVEFSKLFPKLP